MGATNFCSVIKKDNLTAKEAFEQLKKVARREYGESYTGSIAEKDSFRKIEVSDANSKECVNAKMSEILDGDFIDGTITDKWGPAGMIVNDEVYIFFGFASC